MNKKNKDRLERTKKELMFIIPAFSYMWEELKNNASEEDKQTRDYVVATQICKSLLLRMSVYKSVQREVVENFNKIRDKLPEAQNNVFLSGLALLTTHMEIKNKAVNIGLTKEIVELQELCFEFFDSKQINDTFEWAENFRREIRI